MNDEEVTPMMGGAMILEVHITGTPWENVVGGIAMPVLVSMN